MGKNIMWGFVLSLWRDGFIDKQFDSMEEFNAWFELQFKSRLTTEEKLILSNTEKSKKDGVSEV